MYLCPRGRDFRPMLFKYGIHIPFCKSLDKLVGQNKPIMFPQQAWPLESQNVIKKNSSTFPIINLLELTFMRIFSPFAII